MPLPADIAMALAGHRVAQGQMSLLQAFLIGQGATLAGSSILYYVGRRGGRPLLFRYGKLLHLNAHRIAQAERLVTRLGPLSVIIGRQIPGLRLAAPLACGVFRIPYRLFLPAMFVGSSIYIGIFIALGMWGGPAMLAAIQVSELPLRWLASTVLLGLTGWMLRLLGRRAREVMSPAFRLAASRRRSVEAALLAGLGASAISGLVLTWLLDLIGIIAQSPPQRALLQVLETTRALPVATTGLSPQRLVVAGLTATVPFQVLMLMLWAVVYAMVFEPRRRGRAAARGLQFALLPWLFMMLVVFPVLGTGAFGLALGAGLIPAAGELLRHAIYGVTLGSVYRLVRLARIPRPRHQAHHAAHQHDARLPETGTALPAAPVEYARQDPAASSG